MPPEVMTPAIASRQLSNEVKKNAITAKAGMQWDIYALAVTFCHLFNHEPAFGDLTNEQIFLHVAMHGKRPAVLAHRVPSAMSALLGRMWSSDPASRPNIAAVVSEISKQLEV